MTEMIEVDVVIAGGGACGVMAALRASEDPDLVVAVFEKNSTEGSNAEISSGSLAAGGTRFQRDAGIDDSPQLHADDILTKSGDHRMSDVVHALCQVAPYYVEWIASLGYPMEIGTDMPRAGMSVPRLHSDRGRRGGRRLMGFLKERLIERSNVAFVDRSPAVGLLTDDAAVVGLAVEQNGARVAVQADEVVLALDGFAANEGLLAEYAPDVAGATYGGVSTCTGDAVPWLLELDVELRNMGSCLRHGLMVDGHGTRINPALPFHGAVFLNLDGARFVDEESLGYSALAPVIQRQPEGKATVVWDQTAMDATIESELMRQSIASDAIRTSADLPELAVALDLPTDRLEEALQPQAGRRRLVAPYHHARVTHGVLATQGGAHVDTTGRVLRAGGDAVPGLRAGGGTAVGLAGPDAQGYSSGNGLLSAFGMGWIIGNELASRSRKRTG